MNEDEHGLSIEDLATQVGVPVRTIRYYIAEGLLPGPGARGKSATYSEEHLLRLRLIRCLVEQRVPLSEVRERISSLSTQDMRTLLAEQNQFVTELQRLAEDLTPRDYISTLLKQARSLRESPGSKPYTESRPDHLQSTPRDHYPCPDAEPECTFETEAETTLTPGLNFEPPGIQAAGIWQRYLVEPGVELHIRSDVVDRYQRLIELLRRAAGQTDR